MQIKALVAFKSKLLSLCRKLSNIQVQTQKTSLYKSSPVSCLLQQSQKNSSKETNFQGFHLLKQSRNMDSSGELKSVSEAVNERKLFPSPVTPAYIKASRASKVNTFHNVDVEDACRSFENYLVEMIVEEGNPRDLMDVEELLYCWKNLKCPVFIDLVCRFYGELCKDLFSPEYNSSDIASSSP